MKKINVLSLFDGMSCGQQALERSGIEVENYYASEIDKYAIQVTMANYPNTIQLGSVVNVDASKLPKIDLLIGGSPCQSFSFAGKRKGMSTKDEQEILTLEHYLQLKAEDFEFEGQSYLFWEYMRLLNEAKPTYFLLENVEMGEKWEKVLSKAIGYNGVHINSALVSAQNRRRIYWTNIGMQPMGLFGDLQSIIEQPKDRGILLKNVLESEVDDKYYLSEKVQERFKPSKNGSNIVGSTAPDFRTIGQRDEVYSDVGKMGCLNATDYKQPKQIITESDFLKIDRQGNTKNNQDKASTLSVGGHGNGNHSDMDLIVYNNVRLNETIELHKDDLEDGTLIDSYNKAIHKDKSITISTRVNASNSTHIVENKLVAMRGRNPVNPSDRTSGIHTEQRLEERTDGKTNTITSVQKDNLIVHNTMPRSSKTGKGGVGPLSRDDGKTYCLDTGNTNAIEIIGCDIRTDEGLRERKNGKSGTLAARGREDESCGQLVLESRKVIQLSQDNKSNGGTQPYQQDRIYDINGISPALSAGKSDLMITDGEEFKSLEDLNDREKGNYKDANDKANSFLNTSYKGAQANGMTLVDGLNANQLKKFDPTINADKVNTLTLAQGRMGSSSEYMDSVSKIANITSRIRRLTPTECERLQTVKDGYTAHVSDSQRYKMLGNGWTVDVISHIFEYLKK